MFSSFVTLSWSTLKSRHPEWLANKSINIIVQAALKKEPELPDVPLAIDLATTPEQLQIVKLVLVSQEMARPFAAPPGLPADRKAALITAFEQTMKDRAFLAEAKTQVLDVDPEKERVSLGVKQLSGDHATLMALVQFTAERTTNQQTTNAPGLLNVEVVRQDGRWKISALNPM